MLQTKTFIVDKPGGLLNVNRESSRREKIGGHATWRDAAFWWAKQHRLKCRDATGLVDVWIEFGTSRPNQRRDPGNFYPTVKAIVDGFTNACVWVDDDSKHVHTNEPTFTNMIPQNKLQITLRWETDDAPRPA